LFFSLPKLYKLHFESICDLGRMRLASALNLQKRSDVAGERKGSWVPGLKEGENNGDANRVPAFVGGHQLNYSRIGRRLPMGALSAE
jgi:hypothetical protein